MSQDNLLKFKSTVSNHVYFSRKNKKKLASVKIELNKFDPTPGVRKRVKYKEAKK